ncbi:hypothetical protein CTI12_AA201900 [Artemisia annua]|uniref:Uncharacterized protein n=1 Tax=Artemisia annua TaxID=35608 RepID=A0A2U1P2A2_ARTAN|nr:hypothetical protein CTI12_AA201900 [Artemisia annua]
MSLNSPNPRLARVLDILFILNAEHEMKCSTTAARHLASSGAKIERESKLLLHDFAKELRSSVMLTCQFPIFAGRNFGDDRVFYLGESLAYNQARYSNNHV